MNEGPCGQSNYFLSDDVRVHFLSWTGPGPNLVIVPGITSVAASWSFVARRLHPQWSVHVMDLRGRGLSDQRQSIDYGEQQMAHDLVRLAERVGTPTAVLGHSAGGRIALLAASSAPALFSKLIVVDPPMKKGAFPPLDYYSESIREVAAGGGVAAVRARLPAWPQSEIECRAKWLPMCSLQAIAATHSDMSTINLFEMLDGIAAEMLVMYPDTNSYLDDRDIQRLLALSAMSKAAEIENSGHMIPWDNLEPFIAHTRSFLAAEPSC